MSKREIVKKVIHLGTWLKDIINDDFMMTVAAAAKDQTGKKRKLKLSRAGLKLIQSRFLQESKSVSYTLPEIKTVTKLSEAPSCVMFVLEDSVNRFRILAFRCGTEADAAQITSLFDQIQLDQPAVIEVKKEDGENWTMKQRNAQNKANANRHMAEIFNERSLANGEVKPNGAVTLSATGASGQHARAGSAKHHPHPQDKSSRGDKGHHKLPSFKRGRGSSKKKHKDDTDYKVVKNKGDEYVIETEVSQYPYVLSTNTHTVLDPEIDVVKTIPVEVKVITDHHHHQQHPGEHGRDDNHLIYSQPHGQEDNHLIYSQPHGQEDNHLIYSQPHSAALPSKPLVYTSHTYADNPVVYRPNSRMYDTRPRPVSYYADPWGSHRRFMGEYSGQPRVVSHHPSDNLEMGPYQVPAPCGYRPEDPTRLIRSVLTDRV
ncbi:hypothetical protein Btru_030663 [Bulinus truncatus]|nr:hypothetical protein Btru_030663 [Bulinus truncatus]